jgi:beta-barrel assembly-enhancing protease
VKALHLLKVAAAGLLAWSLSGCETMNQMAELTTSILVETGDLKAEEAESINRTTRAVTKTFEDITPEQEFYIGRTVAATVLLGYAPFDQSALNGYVNRVGQSLAQFSKRPETFGGYRFLVLDSDDINAFAAPGGLIFATRGLLRCCETEDELAAVLAHEIGHVENVDGLRAIKTGRLSSALTILAVESGKTLGGADLAEVAKAFDESINDITSTLVNSGYSRRIEYQADAAAIEILRKAGYAPGALVAMLENMEKNWNPTRLDFAATHPPPGERIAQLRRRGIAASKETIPERQVRFDAAVRGL